MKNGPHQFCVRRLLPRLGLALVLSAAVARSDSPPESVDLFPDRQTYLNFSFDRVSIPAFVTFVGEVTGRRFVVADDVEGKITVVSPKISPREAYPLFVSILEAAGCSIVQDGEIHRVVKMPGSATPMATVVGPTEQTPRSGIVTKIFRVKHVSVSELRRLLEPKVRGGREGGVGAVEETNHLVITDTAESIRRIESIIAELDQPGLARTTEVVPLKYASAESLAAELNETMDEA
ncbi:MAG: hypothetical protein O3A51_04405, partial [Verrucomicrobia bacterium]|nr:hypothetical protein [Verrucomicrobiota bacterium]